MSTNRAPRAYRRPVTVEATAARIARSIQEHAAQGIARTPADYGARAEVAARVAALLTQKEVLTHE